MTSKKQEDYSVAYAKYSRRQIYCRTKSCVEFSFYDAGSNIKWLTAKPQCEVFNKTTQYNGVDIEFEIVESIIFSSIYC